MTQRSQQQAEATLINGDQHTVEPPATPRLSFGVGSWDFGVRLAPHSKITPRQYIAILTQHLEGISSLNNLVVEPESCDEGDVTLPETNLEQNGDTLLVLSHTLVYRIDFDLYIPDRIQQELAKDRLSSVGDLQTEHFRVHLCHAYHAPVVFIELLGDAESAHPSTAVVVVREYLRSRCDESSNGLEMKWVGPTPFHADFFLKSRLAEEGSSVLQCEKIQRPGYSKINFIYSEHVFDNVSDALEELTLKLQEEFGLFYMINTIDSQRIRCWEDIEKLLAALTERFDRVGWRRLLPSRRASLKELSIALARFEADKIATDYTTEQAFRHTYGRGLPTFLRDHIETAIASRFTFPTGPTAALLKFIENRRAKALELLVIIAAAVVGGITGAMITIWATP